VTRTTLLAATVVAVCLLSACAELSYEDGALVTRDDAIVGGTPTEEWPAVGLYLMDGGAHGLCTGTLVQPGFVLTAAHCAVGAGPDDLFMIGHDAWAQFGNQYHTVASAHIHPDYTGDSWNFHDIAVLRLDEPVEDVDWIPVNTTRFDHTWEDRWFHYVGFGSDSYYGGPGSGIKRETDLQLTEYYLEIFMTWTQGTNTCTGDSGGPALVDLDGHWYVAGVNSTVWATSEGADSCAGGATDIRVDHELDFLEEFFDPYETPYPDPEPEGDDDDGDDDAEEEPEEEGDGCECRVGEGSSAGAISSTLLLAIVLGIRSRR